LPLYCPRSIAHEKASVFVFGGAFLKLRELFSENEKRKFHDFSPFSPFFKFKKLN
jgi:hypothetical protein